LVQKVTSLLRTSADLICHARDNRTSITGSDWQLFSFQKINDIEKHFPLWPRPASGSFQRVRVLQVVENGSQTAVRGVRGDKDLAGSSLAPFV
jgi:hypothetical protein